MKKILSIIITIALIISLVQIAPRETYAASKVWNGTADTSWYREGIKTFNLSTPEQLAGLSALCDGGNTFSGVTINLTADIVLNDTTNFSKWTTTAPKNVWNPIGGISSWVRERHFDGVFNGNGHTITGMYVNCGKPGGFFSVAQKAAIVNVRFDKCLIVPNGDACGTIVGESYYSYIANCVATNVKIYENDSNKCGNTSVGALVGASPVNRGGASVFMAFMAFGLVVNPLIIAAVEDNRAYDGTVITDCKVDNFTLSCGTNNGNSKVGGVIGRADNGAFLFNLLVINGNISANDTGKANESTCGILHAGGKGEISNCYFYNVSTNNAAKMYGASENLKKVSRETLISEAFVKQLGSQYKAVKSNAPDVMVTSAANTAEKVSDVFTDVLDGKWYSNEILYVYKRGAMTGKSEGIFDPLANIQRSETIAMLYKLEGSPKVDISKPVFPDVTTNNWYNAATIWGKTNGIINGVSKGKDAGKFLPKNQITRQDFTKILYEYAKYKGYDVSVKSATSYKEVADSGKISSYAIPCMNWGYENKFIANNSNFNPNEKITRREAAVILARFLEKYDYK